jgi:hypothetical protein
LCGSFTAPEKSFVGFEIIIDGAVVETVTLEAYQSYCTDTLFWNFDLPEGKHTLKIKWLNPQPNANVYIDNAVIYVNG